MARAKAIKHPTRNFAKLSVVRRGANRLAGDIISLWRVPADGDGHTNGR